MRKIIDLSEEKMVDSLGVKNFTTRIEQKRSVLGVLEVQFARGGIVQELLNDAEGVVEIKVRGEYDPPVPITGAPSWTKVGSGEDTYYRFVYGLINPAINALLGVDEPANFTATAATNIIAAVAHGLSVGDKVQFTTSDTLPAGLKPGIHYFVITDSFSVDQYKVSATSGGVEVDITDTGTGTHQFVKVSNDQTQATLMIEVSWTEGGRNYKTQTVDYIITNDVNRTDDDIPGSPGIVYERGGIRFGTDEPPSDSLGVDDDIYVNEDSGNVYQRISGTYTIVGNFKGRDAGFEYVFNSATSGDPTTGKFLFDHATFGSATHCHIYETDNSSNPMATFLSKMDDGTSATKCLVIARKRASSAYFAFFITGVLSDSGSYDIFPITPISTNGSIANNDVFELVFIRTGDKGDTGAVGALTQNYSSTITDADPGSGIFRLNSLTISAVTAAYLDNNESGGSAISAWLDTFDDSTNTTKGQLTLKGVTSPTAFAIFRVTGSVVDGSGYRKLTLVYLNTGGTFTNGETFALTFSRTGDTGAPGVDGDDGTDGDDGAGYLATSTSSLSIGTGSKSFATQANLAYTVGARIRASSASNTANYMEGLVTSYTGSTLVATITKTGGSGGPYTDWNINLAGDSGQDGADGADGSDSINDNAFSMEFDGSNDYVEFGASIVNLNADFTIAKWIKPDSTSNTAVFSGVTDNTHYWMLILRSSGPAGLVLQFQNAGALSSSYVPDTGDGPTISTGVWTHIALTRSGNSWRLYVNAVLYGAPYTVSLTNFDNSSNQRLGMIDDGVNSPTFFDGKIDDLRIWNVARTAPQILADYLSELVGTESGLTHYYPNREGAGTKTEDISGSADGTTHNGPTWSQDVPFGIYGNPVRRVLYPASGATPGRPGDIAFDGANFSWYNPADQTWYEITSGTAVP